MQLWKSSLSGPSPAFSSTPSSCFFFFTLKSLWITQKARGEVNRASSKRAAGRLGRKPARGVPTRPSVEEQKELMALCRPCWLHWGWEKLPDHLPAWKGSRQSQVSPGPGISRGLDVSRQRAAICSASMPRRSTSVGSLPEPPQDGTSLRSPRRGRGCQGCDRRLLEGLPGGPQSHFGQGRSAA